MDNMPTHRHAIGVADAAAMAGMRAMMGTLPPIHIEPETRPFFDQMIEQTPAASNVDYEFGSIGGVAGWWCRPEQAAPHAAILYLHGGGYVIGSAAAYRHPVSQIAAISGVNAFVPEYALAPERPFPAAVDDAVAAYDGLVDLGFTHIVIAGDSAGGGLTLALCAILGAREWTQPVAAIAISPLTDLTASGQSYSTRAAVDPILSRDQVIACRDLYLAAADPADPRASPLFGPASNLPAILIHVGEDEVLLDDSTRYAHRAEREGANVDLHVWEGMVHVFTSNIDLLEAARSAQASIGEFIRSHIAHR
jgi:epsilon-lactone hydrolase